MTTIRERHQTYRNDGREWCRAEGREAPCDAAQVIAAGDALAGALHEIGCIAPGGEAATGQQCYACKARDRWAEVTGPER